MLKEAADHKRSQWDKGGILPTFLAYLVISCFGRWCHKQNTVARVMSKFLTNKKFCAGYAAAANNVWDKNGRAKLKDFRFETLVLCLY